LGANVAIYQGDVFIGGTSTDETGYYFYPLPENTSAQDYIIRVTYIGYAENSFRAAPSGLSLSPMLPGLSLEAVVIIDNISPMISRVGLLTGAAIIHEQIMQEEPVPEPDYLAIPEEPTVKLFPNPFFQQIQLDIRAQKAETWLFQLINMNGQVVFEVRQQVAEGRQILSIDLSSQNLSGGSYVFAVSNGAELIFSDVVIRSQGTGKPGNSGIGQQ
ncbi:MAG: T9SS type A sorting domain-containing protein, partial [Phaeodactylibacter sp.]|nr:T9SS type A sorting domain-containing protein [Phaeodactylibacter sp.]